MGNSTKQQMIDVAIRLISRKGYHGTAVSDVSKALGVRNATIYHYVASKQELLFLALSEALVRLLAAVGDLEEGMGDDDALLELSEIVKRHLRFTLERPDDLQIILAERRFLEAPYREKFQALLDGHYARITALVQRAMDHGQIPAGDARIIALSLIGMVNGMPGWYRAGGRLSEEQVFSILHELGIKRLLGARDHAPDAG